MNTEKRQSLPAFVARNITLQKVDYGTLLGIVLAVFAIMQVILLVIAAASGEREPLGICLPSIFALCTGVLMALVKTGSSFSSEFRMGVHMSIPRRWMLAACAVDSLLESLLLVALAAVLNAGWVAIFGSYSPEARLVSMLPGWAWAMLVCAPVGVGILGGSILLRFGRRGFWVLYAVFMSACFLPQFFSSSIPAGMEEAVLAALPVGGAVGSALCAAVGIALLWRVPISE